MLPRLSARLLALILFLPLAAVAAPSSASTQPDRVPGGTSSEFDPTSTGFAYYHDQTSAQFTTTYNTLSASYLPLDLDVDTTGGGYAVGSVWQSNPTHRAYRLMRDMTDQQFHDYWTQAGNDGYRLSDQETYVVNGAREYAGIWIANTEKSDWASRRGQSASDFATARSQYTSAGMMPVDIDEYVDGGAVRYSSAWVAAPGVQWQLVTDLTSAQWSSQFSSLRSTYRVLAFDSYTAADGTQRYSGIYVANTSGRGWGFVRDMDATAYANYAFSFRDQGYRMVGLDRYSTPSGVRYAASWRQNNNLASWTHRAAFDSAITSEMTNAKLVGVSVAAYQNGVPMYTRGFGYADRASGAWMDSTDTGNLASVSKAVAGVLTMRMVEEGKVQLAEKTRTLVPSMPVKQDHTIGQLASMRGCVRHYVSGKDPFQGKPFATALAAAQQFWNDDLVCDPATQDVFHYSTHSYTLLGAALEAAGGEPIKSLVRDQLTTPYQLGTLGPQLSGGHHMTQYDANGNPIATPINDWKVLGGGLDSDVADLAAFGDKVVTGKIVSKSTLTTMWTPPDSLNGTAYGWDTGSYQGHRVAGKGGDDPGVNTYLLLYPDLGITVAVMTNSRNDNRSAGRLAFALGGIMTS